MIRSVVALHLLRCQTSHSLTVTATPLTGVTLDPVPEPSSILLLGTVLVGVGFGIKRKFSSTFL
jgi:hypothetical protein